MDADELNKQISLLRGEYPQIKHLGMNEDETAFSIEFDSQREALEYFQKHPEFSKTYHYVRYEIWKPYTGSIEAAWELLSEISKTNNVTIEPGVHITVARVFDHQYFLTPIITEHGTTAPEAISRAWITWHEGQGQK